MSTHVFTVPDERSIPGITLACLAAFRWPNVTDYAGTTLTLTFTPDLAAGETTTLAEIVRAAVSVLTRAERNGIESDVTLLRTYQGIATPTLAQTVAATKAQTRVIRALLRD